MDEIPEDVRKAAERLVVDSANRGGPLVTALIEPIARAILAERARCAKVAEGYYDNSALLERRPGPTKQEGIAKAIRTPDK